MSLDGSAPVLDAEVVALLDDLAEHGDTVRNLLDTFDTLDGIGALDLLRVIGTRDANSEEQLYETLTENPGDLRAVQNLSLLAGGLSQVEPDTLAAVIDTIVDGPPVPPEQFADSPEVGPLGALKKLRDPDVKRGVGTVFLLLEAIGSRGDPEDATGPEKLAPD